MDCPVLTKVLKKKNCKLNKTQLVSLRNEMLELGNQEFINALNDIVISSPIVFLCLSNNRSTKFWKKVDRCDVLVRKGKLTIPKYNKKGIRNGNK